MVVNAIKKTKLAVLRWRMLVEVEETLTDEVIRQGLLRAWSLNCDLNVEKEPHML